MKKVLALVLRAILICSIEASIFFSAFAFVGVHRQHQRGHTCSKNKELQHYYVSDNLKSFHYSYYQSSNVVILHSKEVVNNDDNNGIELATMENLDSGDYEQEGQGLADSIAAWLDQEWMPQEVHMRVGLCAKESLLNTLETKGNAVEVSDVMISIVDALYERWNDDCDGDNEAFSENMFVNAWDVGNYASDYLMQRILNIESCACNTAIVEPMPTLLNSSDSD